MLKKFKIKSGETVNLNLIETKGSHYFFKDEDEAKKLLIEDVKKMEQLQRKLFATGEKAILVIFQGMDTAGKDSCIRHIFSGVNPQGCSVTSFKQPTSSELSHDFMWRHYAALPPRGFITIFNRSYYENLLITRVHPELLLKEKIPSITNPETITDGFWKERFKTINAFEKQLTASGTTVLKFFLHISKGEQKKRLLQRIEDKDKNWKFEYGDLKERTYWHQYQNAYEDMLSHTSLHHAHWYAIPADEKWFSRVAISRILVKTMEDMNLSFPVIANDKKQLLQKASQKLKHEK
ncbi:MAG: polyphosphate kinase 2 family protein [Chitinophagaceae bacterium]|nr:polyphosphate kinase 2 family protein [Chitinophagaceae bacterium]